jgi:hypothetical protein
VSVVHGFGERNQAAQEIVEKRLSEIGNAHAGSDAYTGRECTRLQAKGCVVQIMVFPFRI